MIRFPQNPQQSTMMNRPPYSQPGVSHGASQQGSCPVGMLSQINANRSFSANRSQNYPAAGIQPRQNTNWHQAPASNQTQPSGQLGRQINFNWKQNSNQIQQQVAGGYVQRASNMPQMSTQSQLSVQMGMHISNNRNWNPNFNQMQQQVAGGCVQRTSNMSQISTQSQIQSSGQKYCMEPHNQRNRNWPRPQSLLQNLPTGLQRHTTNLTGLPTHMTNLYHTQIPSQMLSQSQFDLERRQQERNLRMLEREQDRCHSDQYREDRYHQDPNFRSGRATWDQMQEDQHWTGHKSPETKHKITSKKRSAREAHPEPTYKKAAAQEGPASTKPKKKKIKVYKGKDQEKQNYAPYPKLLPYHYKEMVDSISEKGYHPERLSEEFEAYTPWHISEFLGERFKRMHIKKVIMKRYWLGKTLSRKGFKDAIKNAVQDAKDYDNEFHVQLLKQQKLAKKYKEKYEPIQCYNCWKIGHIAVDCDDEKRCMLCGKFGHIIVDCEENTERCNNCGRLGHHEKDCTETALNANQRRQHAEEEYDEEMKTLASNLIKLFSKHFGLLPAKSVGMRYKKKFVPAGEESLYDKKLSQMDIPAPLFLLKYFGHLFDRIRTVLVLRNAFRPNVEKDPELLIVRGNLVTLFRRFKKGYEMPATLLLSQYKKVFGSDALDKIYNDDPHVLLMFIQFHFSEWFEVQFPKQVLTLREWVANSEDERKEGSSDEKGADSKNREQDTEENKDSEEVKEGLAAVEEEKFDPKK